MGAAESFLRGGDEVWLLLRKLGVADDVSNTAAILLDFFEIGDEVLLVVCLIDLVSRPRVSSVVRFVPYGVIDG